MPNGHTACGHFLSRARGYAHAGTHAGQTRGADAPLVKRGGLPRPLELPPRIGAGRGLLPRPLPLGSRAEEERNQLGAVFGRGSLALALCLACPRSWPRAGAGAFAPRLFPALFAATPLGLCTAGLALVPLSLFCRPSLNARVNRARNAGGSPAPLELPPRIGAGRGLLPRPLPLGSRAVNTGGSPAPRNPPARLAVAVLAPCAVLRFTRLPFGRAWLAVGRLLPF